MTSAVPFADELAAKPPEVLLVDDDEVNLLLTARGAARAGLPHHRITRRRTCAATAGRLGAGHHRARRDDAGAGWLCHLPPAARDARLRERAGADAHRAGRRRVDHPRLPGRRHRLLRQGQPVEPARRPPAIPAARLAHAHRAGTQPGQAGARAGPGAHGQLRLAARRHLRQRRLADAVGAGPARARLRPGRQRQPARHPAPGAARRAPLGAAPAAGRGAAQLGAGHRRAGDAARRPPAHHPCRGRAGVQRARPRRRLHRHRPGRHRPSRCRGPHPPPGELRFADRAAQPAPAGVAHGARDRTRAAPGPPLRVPADRSGPLQDHQRHARPCRRRRAADGGGAAPARLRAPQRAGDGRRARGRGLARAPHARSGGPPGWRRVHRAAARDRRRARRAACRRPHPGSDARPGAGRRAGMFRHRQRGHRHLPARRRVGGRPDAQFRRGHVLGQVAGQGRLGDLQPAAGRARAREAGAGKRAAQGHRARRTGAALPADGRRALGAHGRRRGADALAARRHAGAARRLHPAGRGIGPDRAAVRMGAARGGAPGPYLAEQLRLRRCHLGQPAQPRVRAHAIWSSSCTTTRRTTASRTAC